MVSIRLGVGGAGRSGDGLRMVSRISLWDLCMDWRGWELWDWVVNG